MTTLARNLRLHDAFGVTGLGVVVYLVLGACAVVAAVMLAVILGGRAYGRTTCANWGAQTGISTKFVVLNWADSGTCLAQAPNGQWVVNSKWVAFVGRKP